MRRLLILLAAAGCGGRAWTWEAALAPSFERADTDGDGRVEREEWAACAPAGRAFDLLDADGSGGLSPAEFLGAALDQDPATLGGVGERLPSEVTFDEGVQFPDPWETRVLDEARILIAREGLGPTPDDP